MVNDLTAKEKAQAGLWLIRQAIMQLLNELGPKQPFEIRDALGLQAAESPTPCIAPSVLKLTSDIGELEKGDGSHPAYSVKNAFAASPQS